VPTISIF